MNVLVYIYIYVRVCVCLLLPHAKLWMTYTHDTASKDQNPINRHTARAASWRRWTHLVWIWPGIVVDETNIDCFFWLKEKPTWQVAPTSSLKYIVLGLSRSFLHRMPWRPSNLIMTKRLDKLNECIFLTSPLIMQWAIWANFKKRPNLTSLHRSHGLS